MLGRSQIRVLDSRAKLLPGMEIPTTINRDGQPGGTKPVQPKPWRYNTALSVEAKEACTEKGLLQLVT
jgi:hypothetical protein